MNATDIKSPADIRNLGIDQLSQLATRLREILLEKLAAHGGHCGPNLGFVEPAIALHYVFDTPKDKIVFDVSHQTYVHKMLTGRIEAFADPAHYDDVTGFTNPAESEYDLFEIGHTSTSVSLATGLAKARDLTGGTENVVAVIGDGSLSGGEALEGLDYAAELGTNFIVVINDNQMSIAENHGGIYENLALLRSTNGAAECNIFKAMGFDYIYVPYGNDLESLIDAFRRVKGSTRPVVVHIDTMKGMGFAPAERDKEHFHFTGPFNISDGSSEAPQMQTYVDVFAAHMLKAMQQDRRIVTLTAGTPGAIGFGPAERARAGSQFVDVGIAEEQAVAMSAGLAKAGCSPVFGVCSTFLQRAYDQLSQDVSINRQPATFVTFYGGVYGMNDVTHLGFFDVPMISNIPGILFLEATCRGEYIAMLDWAIRQTDTPVVVRTPSGAIVEREGDFDVDYATAPYELVEAGSGPVAIIAAGDFLPLAQQAAEILRTNGVEAAVYNPRKVCCLDTATLDTLAARKLIITLEDNSIDGGFGQKVAAYMSGKGPEVRVLGLPKAFPDRYNRAQFMAENKLTPQQIANIAMQA